MSDRYTVDGVKAPAKRRKVKKKIYRCRFELHIRKYIYI